MFFNQLIKILLLIKITFGKNFNKINNQIILILVFILSFLGFDSEVLCESSDSISTEDSNNEYKKYLIIFFSGVIILGALYYFNGFYSSPSVPPNLLNNDIYANVNIIGKIRAIDVIQTSEIVYFQIDKFSKTIQYCSIDFNEFCDIADQLSQVAVLDTRSFTAITSHTYYNLISGMDMIHIINDYGLTFPKK